MHQGGPIKAGLVLANAIGVLVGRRGMHGVGVQFHAVFQKVANFRVSELILWPSAGFDSVMKRYYLARVSETVRPNVEHPTCNTAH